MHRGLIVTLLGLACTIPIPGWAAEAASCNDRTIASETPLGQATASAGPRIYLRSDAAPCPNETQACRGRAYVVPGDTLLTGVRQGPYVCALFAGKSGQSLGYVRQDEITPQPASTPPPITAWMGKWRDGDNNITLQAKGSQLVANGNAYWPSANPSLKDRPGGPNLGEMSGVAAPQGNQLVFAGKDPDDCKVTAVLLPPILVVTDNGNCGGMNVSFSGVYRKR